MKVNCIRKLSGCPFCGLLARQVHEGDNYLNHFTLPAQFTEELSFLSESDKETERWGSAIVQHLRWT
jgi:hypothetical protein